MSRILSGGGAGSVTRVGGACPTAFSSRFLLLPAVGLATAVVVLLIARPLSTEGAFVLDDVVFWTGAPDAPDVHRAALVVDWNDGLAPVSHAWGYRWPAGESRTGGDLLRAIADADPRLIVSGLDAGFVDGVRLDFTGFGEDSPVRAQDGFDPATQQFWNYWVNNAVEEGNFTPESHLLPPSGDPFAPDGEAGMWFVSNTGIFDRPLADGSWDGFVYAEFGALAPREPVAIGIPVPVPEPSVITLILCALGIGWVDRRRADARWGRTAEEGRSG